MKEDSSWSKGYRKFGWISKGEGIPGGLPSMGVSVERRGRRCLERVTGGAGAKGPHEGLAGVGLGGDQTRRLMPSQGV